MSSSGLPTRVSEWALSQRNLTIFVAILVAVPTAYIFQSTVGTSGLSGDFLLLVTLAVGVPTAYDEHWPKYDVTWKAIAWILIACFVATIEFTGIYLFGTKYILLSPLLASVGAFLVTDLGNIMWLSYRSRT